MHSLLVWQGPAICSSDRQISQRPYTGCPVTESISPRGSKEKNARTARTESSGQRSQDLRDGYHNTRITDIARHAGVAYGLVYHYFGSKQNILEVILKEVGVRFNERLDRISREDIPVREKLGRISDYMFDSYLANEDMIHLLVNEVVRSWNRTGWGDIIRGLYDESRISLVRDGDPGPALEPQVLALSFFGSVQMLLASSWPDTMTGEMLKKSIVIRRLKNQMRLLLESRSYGQN